MYNNFYPLYSTFSPVRKSGKRNIFMTTGISADKRVASSLPVTKSLRLPLLFLIRLPHPCRAIVPFVWDDGGSQFPLPYLPLSPSISLAFSPPSHVCLQPYALCPMPHALCALLTFSSSQLLTFYFIHLPHSDFRIPYLPSFKPNMV